MATTPTTLRNASDTYVAQGNPTDSFPNTRRLYVNTGSSLDRRALIFFGIPFPRGATLISAKLRVFNDGTWSGSRTLTVKAITGKWSRQEVNWNTKPTVSAALGTVTKTGAADKTLWEFDVLARMQSVSNGTAWYGFEITSNATSPEKIYSSEAIEDYRPVLEIAWSDAPDQPTELVPRSGLAISVQYPTFQCDFTDVSGDTDMQAIQVQTSTAAATNTDGQFTTIEWNSGAIANTVPELITDSSLPGYQTLPAWSGVALNATKYWIVRVQDSAGVWSPWSAPESFVRTAKSVWSLDNPSSGTPIFYEQTPPIIWSKTSGTPTQKVWQVILLGSAGYRIWTSGKVSSSATTVTLPKGLLRPSTGYQLVLRIWDNVDRIGIPNDPTFTEIVRLVTLDADTLVTAPTGLTAVDLYPYPWVQVDWSRTTAPDLWDIYRDSEPIDTVTAPETSQGGTAYRYVDRLATPYEQHTYEVRAVVNNKASKTNPTVNVTPRSLAPCLSFPDGSDPVFFMNQSVEAGENSNEEIVEFIGDAPPILISQSVHGFEGTVSGSFVGGVVTGLSARAQRNSFRRLRKARGRNLRLVLLDEAMKVFIYNAKYVPVKDSEGVFYQAQFDFVQVDY